MEFSAWCVRNNYDERGLTDTQRRHLTAAWRSEIPYADLPDGQTIEDAIGAMVQRYVKEDSRQTAAYKAIEQQAVEGGWDLKKTELALFRQKRTLPAMGFSPRSTGSLSCDILCASMAMSCGVSESQLAKLVDEPIVMDSA